MGASANRVSIGFRHSASTRSTMPRRRAVASVISRSIRWASSVRSSSRVRIACRAILGFFQRLFGVRCGLIRVGRGCLELQHRHLPLGPCFQPLSLLLGQAGGVVGQPSQLAGQCRGSSRLGLLTGAKGTFEVSLRGLEPGHDLRLLDLAVDPGVARRFLLLFQVGEPGRDCPRLSSIRARASSPSVSATSISDQPPLGALDPFLKRGELRLGLAEVASG